MLGDKVSFSSTSSFLTRLIPCLKHKSILSIVLLCDIIPTIIVKTTAPLYVMRLSYISRVMVTVAVALLSFFLVAFANSMAMALMGVVCASISSGLGEITFLAMCSLYHKVRQER